MRRGQALMTLAIAAVVCLLAVPLIMRIEFDSSLDALVVDDDPATAASLRVLNDFDAADDLLVVVNLPDDGPNDSTALETYAQRFEQAIVTDPQAKEMVEAVTYRTGEDVRRFIEEVIVPHGLYYLGDAQVAELMHRLTPEGMRRQIRRTEQLLASPAPAAAAVASDPLRLHELLFDSMNDLLPRDRLASDLYLSDDQRSLLIRVGGVRPPTDLAFTQHFIAAVQRIAAQAQPGRLRVQLSGSYAIANVSYTVIRADMIRTIAGSILLLQLLFLLVYRRWWSFVVAFLPVGAGILVGFGAFSLLRTRMTPVGAGIGAILSGLGIDYAIHALVHHSKSSEGRDARGLAADMLRACLTTAAGFAAIGFSRVPALRDFAILGTLGLIASVLATLVLLPALLRLGGEPFAGLTPRLHGEAAFAHLARYARAYLPAGLSVVVVALATAVASYPDEGLLDHSSEAMHPQPNEPLAVQRHITERFRGAARTVVIHLQARDADQLLERARQVEVRVAAAGLDAQVDGRLSLASLLPSPPRVAQRREAIAALDPSRVIEDFEEAIGESAFDLRRLDTYTRMLGRWLSGGDSPDLRTLIGYPGLSRLLLPQSTFEPDAALPTQALTLVMLNGSEAQRQHTTAVITDAIGDVPGVAVTGLSVVGRAVERTVRQELPRLTLAAAGFVVALLLITFRSISATLLALIPMMTGAAFLVAAMTLSGMRLNLVTLIALPLLAGIGVDYGIFFVGADRRVRVTAHDNAPAILLRTMHAIAVCAATTIIGFGSLMFTHVPAMRSLGLAMAAGIAGCCVGTFLILLPAQLIQLRDGTMRR